MWEDRDYTCAQVETFRREFVNVLFQHQTAQQRRVQIRLQRQLTELHSYLESSLNFLGGPCEGQSKNWDMPLCVACARYSLVKGERIVRFALTTRLL